MDEDHVFTKRFIECVKKTGEERSEQVRPSYASQHDVTCMCVCEYVCDCLSNQN